MTLIDIIFDGYMLVRNVTQLYKKRKLQSCGVILKYMAVSFSLINNQYQSCSQNDKIHSLIAHIVLYMRHILLLDAFKYCASKFIYFLQILAKDQRQNEAVLDSKSKHYVLSLLSSPLLSWSMHMSQYWTELIHQACLTTLWLILLVNTPALSGFQSLPPSIPNSTNRLRTSFPSLCADPLSLCNGCLLRLQLPLCVYISICLVALA